MKASNHLHTMQDLRFGEHVCYLYETGEEHQSMLRLLLSQGLGQNEKVLYIGDTNALELIRAVMQDSGLSVETYLASGQLRLYIHDGSSARDPEKLIAVLRTETELSQAEGYTGLRVTSETYPAVFGLLDHENLLNYEARLNTFVASNRCLIVCQYDRRCLSFELLLTALVAHPIIAVGTTLYDNFYYIPPAKLLEQNLPSVTLGHLLENLVTLRTSEEGMHTLLESINDAVFMLDDSGYISYISPAIETIVDYTVAEIISKPFNWLAHPDDIASLLKDLKNMKNMENDKIERSEFRLRNRDGNSQYVHLTCRLLQEGNKGARLLGVITDIGSRKKAEDEVIVSCDKLERSLQSIIQSMAKMIEVKDAYTGSHQQRVAKLACIMAREMGLPEDKIEGIHMSAVIHDIGKMHVPTEILNKTGRLTDAEFSIVKAHSKVGYDILKNIEFPWPVAQIVLQHHERMDGSGYPSGLSGDDIMEEARILGLADVFEAMISQRPYRPAIPVEKALDEISHFKGTLFDGDAVEVLLRLISEKGFKFCCQSAKWDTF